MNWCFICITNDIYYYCKKVGWTQHVCLYGRVVMYLPVTSKVPGLNPSPHLKWDLGSILAKAYGFYSTENWTHTNVFVSSTIKTPL